MTSSLQIKPRCFLAQTSERFSKTPPKPLKPRVAATILWLPAGWKSLNPAAKIKCHNIIVRHDLITVISLSLRQLDNPLAFWYPGPGIRVLGTGTSVFCPLVLQSLLRTCLYFFGSLGMGLLCTVKQSVRSTVQLTHSRALTGIVVRISIAMMECHNQKQVGE